MIQRVRGNVDRVEVHHGDRRQHLGNEDEYLHFRQKMEEERRARGKPQTAFEEALAKQHERATRDQRRESESRERQRYAREWEEQIDFEQSEPDFEQSELDFEQPEPNAPTESDPTVKTDPPTELEPPSRDTHKKVKISLDEYRERSARSQEDDANTAPPTAQHQQATVGSHMPCYDEYGLELDYHDDVPAADSRDSLSCSDYIHQLLDEEHATPPADKAQPSTARKETVPPEEMTPAVDVTTATNPEWEGWCHVLEEHFGDRLDVEDPLQGPTEPVTVTEEAELLEPVTATEEAELLDEEDEDEDEEETPTIGSVEPSSVMSQELTPTAELQEMPANAEEPIDPAWSREILAGLQNLTPGMLAEVSAHIERIRQLATPPVPSKPSPPGLPAMPTVCYPMEEALLHAVGDLGVLPCHRHTPMCLPGAEEIERAATELVEQMSKAPGTPARRLKNE